MKQCLLFCIAYIGSVSLSWAQINIQFPTYPNGTGNQSSSFIEENLPAYHALTNIVRSEEIYRYLNSLYLNCIHDGLETGTEFMPGITYYTTGLTIEGSIRPDLIPFEELLQMFLLRLDHAHESFDIDTTDNWEWTIDAYGNIVADDDIQRRRQNMIDELYNEFDQTIQPIDIRIISDVRLTDLRSGILDDQQSQLIQQVQNNFSHLHYLSQYDRFNQSRSYLKHGLSQEFLDLLPEETAVSLVSFLHTLFVRGFRLGYTGKSSYAFTRNYNRAMTSVNFLESIDANISPEAYPDIPIFPGPISNPLTLDGWRQKVEKFLLEFFKAIANLSANSLTPKTNIKVSATCDEVESALLESTTSFAYPNLLFATQEARNFFKWVITGNHVAILGDINKPNPQQTPIPFNGLSKSLSLSTRIGYSPGDTWSAPYGKAYTRMHQTVSGNTSLKLLINKIFGKEVGIGGDLTISIPTINLGAAYAEQDALVVSGTPCRLKRQPEDPGNDHGDNVFYDPHVPANVWRGDEGGSTNPTTDVTVIICWMEIKIPGYPTIRIPVPCDSL